MRASRRAFEASQDFYHRTLGWSLDNRKTVMAVLLIAVVLNVYLFMIVPKGFFPQTDEGRINGMIRGDQDISFQAMQVKFQKFVNIVRTDPAIATVAGTASAKGGNLFITLKPPAERGGVTTQQVIDRLRRQLFPLPGIRLFMFAAQDLRAGARQSDSEYQHTLTSPDVDLLQQLAERIEAMAQVVEKGLGRRRQESGKNGQVFPFVRLLPVPADDAERHEAKQLRSHECVESAPQEAGKRRA